MSSSPELLSSPLGGQMRPQRFRSDSRPTTRNGISSAKVTPLIEITDSEDEDDDPALVQPGPSRQRSVLPVIAGSSRVRKPFLKAKPPKRISGELSAASTDNTPVAEEPPARVKSRVAELPLFLPSDEEHIPTLPHRELVIRENSDESEVVFEASTNSLTPAKTPPREVDPTSQYLVQVLEVVPDIQPDYATSLILQYLPQFKDQVVQGILHVLFEDSNYPKIDKRKRKAEDNDRAERKRSRTELPDYGNVDREFNGGIYYTDLALDQLSIDFPDVPKPFFRKILSANKKLYAPTHLFFAEAKSRGPPYPYIPKKTIAKPRKGKNKQLHDGEFEREREWVLSKDKQNTARHDAELAEKLNEEQYEECGDSIECGCCFSSYPFDKMVQCEDAHLFCSSCVTSYAEGLLGSHNISIVCMDQSGCKQPFPISELRRLLPERLMELYERVKQRKEIEMAGLENLEECPFCDFKCVIENPDERLFRCGNEDTCGTITCRQCKKLDHLPKSCTEMEEDRKLDGRHVIEEAMTRALMRTCPNCGKAFVKEDGCNKMTCPNCRTLSCYVCRKVIKGYDHFGDQRGAPGQSSSSSKCPLWEPVDSRHTEDVKAAATKAMEEYKRENPDVDEKDIQVELPTAKPLQQGMPGLPAGYLPPIPPPPGLVVPFERNPYLPILPVGQHNRLQHLHADAGRGFPMLRGPNHLPGGAIIDPIPRPPTPHRRRHYRR